MAEARTQCITCNASILVATAEKNGGKCVPCASGTRKQIDEGKRWAAEQRERERKNEEALARIRQMARPPVLGDFISEDDPFGVLWPLLVDIVYLDDRAGDVEALSPVAKVIYLVNVLDGEVYNGGFHQYFSNSSGKHAHETLAALNELGAFRKKALLQRAIDLFPGNRVPANRQERYDELEKISEDALEALAGEFYALGKDHGEDTHERILSFMKQHARASLFRGGT